MWKNLIKSENIKYLFILLAGAALFLAGRHSTPPKVVEVIKEVVVEKEKLKVVEVEKIIIEKNKESNEAKRIHKERTEESRPDGTKIVKETTDINVDKTVKEVEVKFVDRVNTVEKEIIVEKKVEIEKIVENNPDWTVTARLGTDFRNLKLSPLAPYVSPIIVGAEVDRRVVGPFKAGLWVHSSIDFNSVSGGLAVGADF